MSILSAIGGLLGGIFSRNDAKKQQQRLMDWQEHMAKNQIRFRVEDAKAAGVHPVAALGASVSSPSPVAVGMPDFSDIGQNIGRAADAVMTADDKKDDFTKAYQGLQLERAQLENDVLRLNLANSAARTVSQVGNPPTLGTIQHGLQQGESRDANKPNEQLKLYDYDIPRNPRFSDTENFTKRYGEMADWVAGPLVALGDMYYSLDKNYARPLIQWSTRRHWQREKSKFDRYYGRRKGADWHYY